MEEIGRYAAGSHLRHHIGISLNLTGRADGVLSDSDTGDGWIGSISGGGSHLNTINKGRYDPLSTGRIQYDLHRVGAGRRRERRILIVYWQRSNWSAKILRVLGAFHQDDPG